jgi:hypothetical protein
MGSLAQKQACQKLWVRLSKTSLSKIMGSLVQNKLVQNYGFACPKQACPKLWVRLFRSNACQYWN